LESLILPTGLFIAASLQNKPSNKRDELETDKLNAASFGFYKSNII
jgi:hypothetical protein